MKMSVVALLFLILNVQLFAVEEDTDKVSYVCPVAKMFSLQELEKKAIGTLKLPTEEMQLPIKLPNTDDYTAFCSKDDENNQPFLRCVVQQHQIGQPGFKVIAEAVTNWGNEKLMLRNVTIGKDRYGVSCTLEKKD